MSIHELPTQLKEKTSLNYITLCIANNIENTNKLVPKNDIIMFVFKSKDKKLNIYLSISHNSLQK
jgi:hypothetical protein